MTRATRVAAAIVRGAGGRLAAHMVYRECFRDPG
jgi:hypothetical protein